MSGINEPTKRSALEEIKKEAWIVDQLMSEFINKIKLAMFVWFCLAPRIE